MPTGSKSTAGEMTGPAVSLSSDFLHKCLSFDLLLFQNCPGRGKWCGSKMPELCPIQDKREGYGGPDAIHRGRETRTCARCSHGRTWQQTAKDRRRMCSVPEGGFKVCPSS